MHIFKSSLYNRIINFSKILIYGAGNYANEAYTFLKSVGLKGAISSFIVTELKEQGNIDGIPIKSADDFTFFNQKETVVLIAVSRLYIDEIEQILRNKNCVNSLKFVNFIMQDDEFIEMLRKQSDEQFSKCIIEKYVWNSNIDSIDKINKKMEEAEKFLEYKNDIDQNTIVYISGDMKPRSEKIIGALVKKNYNVIVLEYDYCNELVKKVIEAHEITYFYCRNIVEVFYKAIQFKPLVYYYEPAWGDCSGPEIMIRHKNLFGKIVFATYDVLNDGYVQISKKNKLLERYCLENADGVVWRWFSKEFLMKRKGFEYKGKSIQFLDYCRGFSLNKNIEEDDKLKLCFVIGAVYDFLDQSIKKNEGIYNESARIDTILKKLGNKDDCVFHIFIGECNNKEERMELNKLENNFLNFKVFYGTSYNELIPKISEYDYGCFLSTGGKDIPELKSIDNMYYGSNFINAEGNRFFDYLDAGIPIVATIPKKQCDFFEKFGVLVKMDICNMDIEYLKKNKVSYKKKVENARNELLIDNQIQRLIDFFNNL